jgi:DNA-binding SARP family transcriptional activator/TolB-like protein/tetratricopeptide (TPR) repeat protein
LSSKEFRLVTLGRLALFHPDGSEDIDLGKRRRKLTLLAVLARAGHAVERDFLIEMFWGDQEEHRARHSLSDALSHLRRVLGADSITARRNDVAINEGAKLGIDASELVQADAIGDARRVTELYGGPFLDFVHVDGSASFDRWASREREQIRLLFLRAAASRCDELARKSDWDGCVALAMRWLDAAPFSADAALQLLRALEAPGTREADARALDEYGRLAARLEAEYRSVPDQRVEALAAEIAERHSRPGPPAESTAEPSAAHHARAPHASPLHGTARGNHSTRRRAPARVFLRRIAVWGTAAAVAVAAAGTLGSLALRAHEPVAPSHPAIAILAIRNLTGDANDSWLSAGLPQMIVADLSRSPAVDVVDPSRVQQLLTRADLGESATLSTSTALDLGRRVGATWVVDGTVSRAGGVFILDFSLRDVATRVLVRPYMVSDANIISLADHAAARLLIAANAQGPGPRLAEVETSSLEAYQHYVRAVRAGDEGREADQRREADAAIALDSGFAAALRMRLTMPGSADDDPDAMDRLSAAFARAAPRASERERLDESVVAALRNGERSRSEVLANLLVERYPHDPHSFATLAHVYDMHGMWAAADTVLLRELALDSLAAEAGQGPCAPCVAYAGLIANRDDAGDLRGAERAADRWIELQPDLPRAWAALSTILSYEQRFDEALRIERRASALAGNDAESRARIGRILIMARRWDEADSLIDVWSRSRSMEMRLDAADLRMVLLRERGQLRAAVRTADSFAMAAPNDEVLRLMKGNTLGMLGEYAAATREYEAMGHGAPAGPRSPASTLAGDRARSFCWEHALEADAIARSGDSVRLRALADSIELMSERSYYGRDWRLAGHVRGLIAMRQHRYADAERDFLGARWGVAGWTRTVAELAQARLALGRPRDAIAALRDAYMGPIDAMGRYEPRSHLDFLMAKSFEAAGIADSAAVYAGYVRAAWRHADPEVSRLLAALP